MKNNRLLIALVALIGVGALAVMASRSHRAETTVDAPTEALPKLKKEEITSIEIVKPTHETIMLVKQGAGWQLTQPVTAAADTPAVDAVLEKLTSLEVSGVAATRKENHARLQVDAGAGLRVKAKAGDKLVLDMFVGVSKSGNTMLRQDGKEMVLAGKGSLRYAFDKEVKMFRDRVITDADTADVTAMVIESEKGTFKFAKKETAWAQAEKEKPIAEFSDTKVQSLASTFARLRAADFAEPSVTADAAGFVVPKAKLTLTLKDGKSIALELGKILADEREYYARVGGNPTIFRISKFTAERMMADAAAFTEDKKDDKAAAEGAPEMPMMGEGPGGQQLPPELMEQLKRQLANQGGAHP